jgi:hypothetical protein
VSEIQVCKGIWRNRSGQRLYITQCEPDDDGQQWTDGAEFYLDDGTYDAILGEGDQDLVAFVGLLPDRPQQDQTAEIDRLRTELEQSQGVRRSLAAEIERLQTELRGYAAETHRQLRTLQESHNKATATLQAEQRGEREGFRIAISMILEALK